MVPVVVREGVVGHETNTPEQNVMVRPFRY